MSDDLQSQLENEEKLILERLAFIRSEKERLIQEEKAKLASQPVTVLVKDIQGEIVFITFSRYRDDLIAMIKAIPTRYWDGTHNRIHYSSFDLFLERLASIPNHILEYSNGTKEAIELEQKSPDCIVNLSKDQKNLIIDIKRPSVVKTYNFPGLQYSDKLKANYIPTIECWRVYPELIKYNIVFAEGVEDAIKAILEKRAAIDTIALKEDSEIDPGFIDPAFKLRSFQKVSIEFLDAIDGRGFIAHEMGLGKSATAIGYAKLNNLRTLVICPANLKVNWRREITKLTGALPYVAFGRVPDINDFNTFAVSRPQWTIINYDCIGPSIKVEDKQVNYTKTEEYRPWIELINASRFDLIVLDESHYIKNVDSKRSQAARKLESPRIICLSGTPVLNRPSELWAALTLIAPDKFPSYESFLRTYTYDGKEARNVGELRETLKSLMFRKTKKEVLKDLPPINRMEDWHELTPKARKVYTKALKGVYEELSAWTGEETGNEMNIVNILAQIMRLKQICAIDSQDHTVELAQELTSQASSANGGEGKVLIFSQFKSTVRGIASRLGHEAVWINGDLSKEERTAIIDRFLVDKSIKYFVATWQVAGEGLNLQIADHVIFNDLFWTPANHEQCEGRAYGRLANPHPINSYWVVVEDSICQWIQELLAKKMSIINQVVEDHDAERHSSILKDLLKKMQKEMKK